MSRLARGAPSCATLRPRSTKMLAPSESGKLTVSFDRTGYAGEIQSGEVKRFLPIVTGEAENATEFF